MSQVPDESPKNPSRPSRRSFIRTFGAALVVAVPALQTLALAQPAAAAAARCDKTRAVFKGTACGRYDYCPAGTAQICYGIYYHYCTCDGSFCRQELEIQGRCKA